MLDRYVAEIAEHDETMARVTDEYRAVLKDRNSEAARAEELAAVVKRQAEELALLHQIIPGGIQSMMAVAQWREKYGGGK